MNKKTVAIMGIVATLVLASSATFAAKTTIRLVIGNVTADRVKVLVDMFEKEYPNIKVNAVVCAWDQVDNKFLAMTAGGQAIDVFCNNSVYGWARYTGKNLFVDLGPYINRDKKNFDPDDFSPLVYNSYKVKGKQISVPLQQFIANSIAYNATMLAEAGLAYPTTDWNSKDWTWEDMITYAKKLTKVGADGKVTQWGIDFWDADNLVTYSWANGEDWYDEAAYKSGVLQKLVLNTPGNIKAYQKLADLRTVHKVRPGVAPAKVGGGIQSFWEGKMGMWMDAQSLQNPTLYKKNYKWGMAPFPAMQGTLRDGFAWLEVMAIPASAKHRQEAWTFIKWMTRKGGAKGIDYPTNPARISMWDHILEWWPLDLAINTKAQLKQYISGGFKHTKVLPRDIVFPSQEVYTAIMKELSPALNGKKDMAQALAAAEKLGYIEVKKMVRK